MKQKRKKPKKREHEEIESIFLDLIRFFDDETIYIIENNGMYCIATLIYPRRVVARNLWTHPTFFAKSFKGISIFFNEIQKYIKPLEIDCGLDLFIFDDLFFIFSMFHSILACPVFF